MNKDQLREYNKSYYIKNQDRIKKRSRQYDLENRDAVRKRKKEWNVANSDKINQYKKEWYSKNPHRVKDGLLRRLYGITFEQYEQMRVSQNGCCAICGNPFRDGKDTQVDHNHTTGKIRQLLCSHCNTGIGNLMDDVSILAKAIEYLNKWKD